MEAAAAAGSAQLAAAQNRKGSSDALYEKRVEVDIFGDVVDKTITRATIESWRDKFENAYSKRPKVEEEEEEEEEEPDEEVIVKPPPAEEKSKVIGRNLKFRFGQTKQQMLHLGRPTA